MRRRTIGGKALDLGVGMGGGEGEAQPCGAGRHRRRPDGDHQEAFRFQKLRCLERRLGFADHQRHDRARGFRQIEQARERARLGERQRRVGGLALDQVERRDRGRHRGRRQAGRIDKRARAVVDQIDHRSRGAQIAAVAADRLRQRAHLQRHIDVGAMREGRAAPTADHADAVGVVGHQPGVVARRERRKLRQRREVAVHGEHAIGRDQRARVPAAVLGEQRLDMRHVGMPERQHGRAREPRAGPQAGMRQLVDQHEVVAADQRRNDAAVGEIARAEHAGRLGAFEAGEAAFELAEQRMIAGHQPRGAAADAMALDRLDGGAP